MNGAVIRRIGWDWRVRLPLILMLVLLWGFALVALFSTVDDRTRTAGLDGNIAIAFRLAGLDPLTAWTALGQVHPILLVTALLFVIGLGVRAVAGELESGSLDLTLARPVSRTSYLCSHVAVLVPGTAVIAVAYAVGTVVADRLFDPPGARLEIGRMLLAAGQAWLLFLAIGSLALLISALSSERGRATAITIGVVLAMYVGNFLFALWEPLRGLTRLSFFRYFTPGPTIQFGDVAWADTGVLAVCAAVTSVAAVVAFSRRDLAR